MRTVIAIHLATILQALTAHGGGSPGGYFAQCFYSAQNMPRQTSAYIIPCTTPANFSDIVNCCALGDTCRSDGLCSNTQTYYISPCTDPSYESPVCPSYCENRPDPYQLDVTYHTSDGLWHCCKPGGPGTCHGVTGEVFKAPEPSKLRVVTNLPPPNAQPSSTPGLGPYKSNPKGGLGTANIVSIVFATVSIFLSIGTLYLSMQTYLRKKRKLKAKQEKQKEDAEMGDKNS